jgi:hypothetical protein
LTTPGVTSEEAAAALAKAEAEAVVDAATKIIRSGRLTPFR